MVVVLVFGFWLWFGFDSGLAFVVSWVLGAHFLFVFSVGVDYGCVICVFFCLGCC